MKTKRLLIGLPLVLLAVLLQSAFWVPTQKRQAKDNPDRLVTYLDGGIGDAAILNPILNADSASSDICDNVFEGLLDRDENLDFRGRLATGWTITEEAYLWIDSKQRFPDGSAVTAEGLRQRLERSVKGAKSDSPLKRIERVEIVAAAIETRPLPPESATKDLTKVDLELPVRIKMTLNGVEQDLFRAVESVTGKSYVKNIRVAQALRLKDRALAEKLAPDLVAAAEHNPVLTFTLREGVKFHDGKPFTAEDVKFTFDSIMDERNISPRVSDYEPVKAVEILDPYHVRIVYKRLYSPAIGTWAMGILPKHLLNAEALAAEAKQKGRDPATYSMRDADFNRHPIGVGPFRFVEWRSDQFIRLQRNEEYWEGAPNYHDYVFRVLPESLTLEMEFYAGTLDGYAPAPHQVARLAHDPTYQSFSGLALGYDYIAYNLRREPFNDPRVRRALGMAINVDDMIRYLYYGHAERITGPFPKQTDYYDQTLAPLPYDPKGALALLKEAGFEKNADGKMVNQKTGKPFRFTLMTNNGNDRRRGILTIAQQSWSLLGIDVATELLEWTVFLQKHVNANDFDAISLGWSLGIDPDLYQIWHSSQTDPQELNFAGYSNPAADDLIVRIRQEYDPQKTIEYCHALHRLIYNDQPYTFLVAPQWTVLLDRDIMRRITTDHGYDYLPIVPTRLGRHTFHFKQWVKVLRP